MYNNTKTLCTNILLKTDFPGKLALRHFDKLSAALRSVTNWKIGKLGNAGIFHYSIVPSFQIMKNISIVNTTLILFVFLFLTFPFQLHSQKKEKLKIEAGAELLYNFQEDLFNRDFNSFYKFFIEDGVEESNGDIEDILRFSEIHPKILKKYRDKIIIGISANKYNI